ncbi:MAG: permease-like cell division protein FtsX [Flavobacteriales bacterium]|jgi:cell division transport system permease protein|nr:cell division protein FtsX [Crocinitomicaceae bacterium]MDG2331434.1 permease-like cell division protein FtsX [Flavobacteriales bacterium]
MAKAGKYSRRKSRTAWVGTLLSMSLLLVMLMAGGYFLLNIEKLSKKVKEQVELDVFFYDTTSEADVKRIEKEIAAQPYVRNAVYVSKDSAFATVSSGIGEDYMNLLDENPFQASINVLLEENYVHIDSVQKFEQWMLTGNEELIEEVYYNKSQFQSVNDSFSNISLWIWGFAILLTVVAVVLIFVTIRLSIYAQRFTIKTMQLVGAKSSFIKRPFLVNSVLMGLASGVVAALLFIGMSYVLWQYNPEVLFGSAEVDSITLAGSTNQNDFKTFALLFGCIVVGGVLISYVSTTLALRKYIRIKTDNLY